MMFVKYFSVFLSFMASSFLDAAVAPCFTYVVDAHDAPGPVNRALDHYSETHRHVKHNDILVNPNPVKIQISLGQFAGNAPALWVDAMPFVGAPPLMNLFNINLVIARRLAHGVVISPTLLANLAASNVAGVITPALNASLTAGGYLNNLASILNRLTLIQFPPGTILGAPMPAFIPDSIIVHIAIPQRVSKNLNELSHSALPTPAGGTSLKDHIDAAYAGIAAPDSATVVSFHLLQ